MNSSDGNKSTDPSPDPVPWPELDTSVLDSYVDSDSDEILFTNPRKVATAPVAQPRVRPPIRRELCNSKLCGVVGIRHSVGPYLHKGVFPHNNPGNMGRPTPPWGQANPPPQVWDAWNQSFSCGVGPHRQTSKRRTAKHQQDVDLVDGFIANHSWFPDEKIFHPASTVIFKQWCMDWNKQRKLGILRPTIEEVYW